MSEHDTASIDKLHTTENALVELNNDYLKSQVL